ncbi:MAG: metal transporter CNNM [Psychromonas sp.]|jgi:metal transporter CNNM
MVDLLIWLAIVFCISQSAIFSGLNLAFFSISRLQLEVEAKRGSKEAAIILSMREDSNFLLSTILWGNVSINVLLTLLSDSVLAGVYSFLFSTVAITFLGEIIPQAYFSRNALKVGAILAPVIRFYQLLLFPVAKLTALILDGWLGREGITYFREKELKAIITAHMDADESEMQHVEGVGALNFLQIDDIPITSEGEKLDQQSLIQLPCKLDLPIIPERNSEQFPEFVDAVNRSGHKWVILANDVQDPLLILDADGFIRSTLSKDDRADPYLYCHRPVIIRDPLCTLGKAMQRLKKAQRTPADNDEVLDHDVILVWNDHPRVITGADILGRLLKGIGGKGSDKSED